MNGGKRTLSVTACIHASLQLLRSVYTVMAWRRRFECEWSLFEWHPSCEGQLRMQVNLRREQRRPAQGTYSICWEESAVSRSIDAKGQDVSASGICIQCAKELRPGTSVFLQGPDGSPTGESFVRHCTPGRGLHRIGLEFGEEARKSLRTASSEVKDYYEFLQINPKAEPATIHRIYRFMAARFHPDNPDTGDPEQFLLLNRIYAVLSDPQRRAEYDESRQVREAEPDPIAEVSAFVDGIDGEVNRRLAILALLYNKRRMNSQDPSVSLWDLERRMALPREYLDFATWYLRSKSYITVADNSDFCLTALGVDYVEANVAHNPMLHKLLRAGRNAVGRENGKRRSNEESYRLAEGKATNQEGLGQSDQGAAGSPRV